jgi:hypothetical protein
MLTALLTAVPPYRLTAQVTVTGQIRHGAHNRPLARQWAVLHVVRPGPGAGGPLDSARTDVAGRYRLTVPRADSAAIYLVSTTYQAVGYFSQAVRVEGRRLAAVEPVVVYDTTVAGPAMRLERRLLTLFRPGGPEGRNVLELIEITNPGTRTRIAPDSLSPVWTVVLPTGATGWEAGEGDVSPEAVWLDNDSVKVFAPIPPGIPRQLSYQYAIGATSVRIPVEQWTKELDVLVQDSTAVLSGAVFDSLGMYELEGRRFAAYRAGPLEAGSSVTVTFSRGPVRAEQLVPFVVGFAVIALAWGLFVALKRQTSDVRHQQSVPL